MTLDGIRDIFNIMIFNDKYDYNNRQLYSLIIEYNDEEIFIYNDSTEEIIDHTLEKFLEIVHELYNTPEEEILINVSHMFHRYLKIISRMRPEYEGLKLWLQLNGGDKL